MGTLVPAWAVSESQTPQHCNEIAAGGGRQPMEVMVVHKLPLASAHCLRPVCMLEKGVSF